MIPSPHELATLAVRRREELTGRLEELAGKSGTSLLPSVLRRCIVTTALCHQTLGVLDRAVSMTMRVVARRLRDSVEPEPPTPAELRYARLWHSHLCLAVNQVFIAYGEILRSVDWRVQRQGMDDLLELLSSIEVVGGLTDQPMALEPIIEGAIRIRALLEARRPETGIAGTLFRDQESLNIEGTSWCYVAMLLAETLRTRADGSASAKGAVRIVDTFRNDVEKTIHFGSPPAPAVVKPAPLPQEVVKSQG
ncbi:MAG TPA: hypothetical protein VKH43_00470 [Thermoanaerobaculia bacterium]|nr:hypothetical protein [Thermoanaerobaculia bacterium]